VLEHVPDLSLLMTNALALLKEGGRFDIEVPYERALTAWQDPTHVRALNQNSWIYYTEWFWYLGWFEHRLNMIDSTYLDLKLQPCTQEHAAFMRVAFMKVETTARERNIARTMQADLRLPDDEFAPAPERRPVVPVYSAPAAGSPAPMKPMPSILPVAAAPVGAPTLPAARPAATAPGGLDIATLDLLATTRSEALAARRRPPSQAEAQPEPFDACTHRHSRCHELLRRPEPQAARRHPREGASRAGARLRQRPARAPLQGTAPRRAVVRRRRVGRRGGAASQHLTAPCSWT
jgi:hypothetical protein